MKKPLKLGMGRIYFSKLKMAIEAALTMNSSKKALPMTFV
jgi:hypothetical protein